eukprot:2846833-Prymnesium_polylepis.1
MSGWDNLEGKNKRTGARMVENAKLQQPGPPRAGPRLACGAPPDRIGPCLYPQGSPSVSSTGRLSL